MIEGQYELEHSNEEDDLYELDEDYENNLYDDTKGLLC